VGSARRKYRDRVSRYSRHLRHRLIVFELTLNDKIVTVLLRRIGVTDVGGLAIERDLEVLVAGLSDGHVFRVKSHGG
jgi:hypothetical protein